MRLAAYASQHGRAVIVRISRDDTSIESLSYVIPDIPSHYLHSILELPKERVRVEARLARGFLIGVKI